MKIKKSLIILILLFSLSSPVNARNFDRTTTEINHKYSNIEKMLESFVYTFDGEIVKATFSKTLRDINGTHSFGLFNLNTNGYAVVAIENQMISELVVAANETSFLENAKYYLGPNTFISNKEFESLKSSSNLSMLRNNVKTNYSDIVQSTNNLLSESNPDFIYDDSTIQQKMSPVITKPSVIVGGTEVGIVDAKMTEFKKVEWQNNNANGKDYLYLGQGICGTIATSIALTYIDNHINSNVVVNSPYPFPSYSYATWLIMKLKNVIEPPVPGSFANDIINGITWFYGTTNSNISGTTLAPISSYSESTYKSNISSGYPVIMYLDVYSQDINPYSLHWVTAYRYVDYNGALWFKAADTWGNLAWINRNWVGEVVYFLH